MGTYPDGVLKEGVGACCCWFCDGSTGGRVRFNLFFDILDMMLDFSTTSH
jgi:hypothetical protein